MCQHKMSMVFMSLLLVPVLYADGSVEVYEYFHNVHNGNRSMAKAACDIRGGQLATDPRLDDWDNHLVTTNMDENMLLSTYFSVSVSKSTSGVWQYHDGRPVDMSSTQALTLREMDSGQYGTYNFDCALWNPWEPFFIPSVCADMNAFICSIPVTLSSQCVMEAIETTRFSEPWHGTLSYSVSVSKEDCKAECAKGEDQSNGRQLCWAAEYDSTQSRCTLLRSDDKPSTVPPVQSDPYRTAFLKSCKTIASFKEDTCSILCRCNTDLPVVIPTTKVEFEELLEEVAEQKKKELFLPTNNLSSEVRKKSSATDSRGSSTGMGAMGITLLTLVFGSLIILDMTSLYSRLREIVKTKKFKTRLI